MSEGTGTVEFRGDRNTVCDEAANYTVTDNDGKVVEFAEVIQPGYQVSDIPADEIVRWVANPKFVAVNAAATEVANAFYKDVAERINGRLVDEADAEAAREAAKPLEERDKAALVELADELGVEYTSKTNKGDLVGAIKAKQAEGSESNPNETTETVGAPPAFGTIGSGSAGTGEEGEGS